MHRQLLPPGRRILTAIRLPLVQHPGERIVDQLQASLSPRDALRTAGTTASNRRAIGPLPQLHTFVLEHVGFPNAPESMSSGLRTKNAPRAANVTRGQSAGM